MGGGGGLGGVIGGAIGSGIGGAILGPVGSIVGGFAGAGGSRTINGGIEDMTGINTGNNSASDMALEAQRNATASANHLNKYIYEQNRADQQPWRDAGLGALGGLQGDDYKKDFTMADFQADPGYAFRMAEGQKAIERSASARGGLNSGATMKALTRFGQDTASSEYGNAYNRFNADRDRRFNRLSSLAGIGQTATNQVQAGGQSYANNYGQNVMGMANAQGAAAIGQANRMSGLLGQGITAGAIMASDRRVKTNLEEISKSDLNEMRHHLRAYKFNYIDDSLGEGDWIGVLAQDLEKSKLGRTLVSEVNGIKVIDMKKAVSVFLASLAEAS